MRKLFALLTAALLTLTLTACQSPDDDKGADIDITGGELATPPPYETTEEEAQPPAVIVLTHPGEYLTDYIQTLSINGQEFPFPITFDGIQAVFGDDMKTYYPDYEDAVFRRGDGRYWVGGDFVFDGYYWGNIYFITENENGEDAVIDFFTPSYCYSELEDDGIRNVKFWENGELVMEEFLFEEGRIPYSFGGFTAGVASQEEISEYFGEVEAYDVGDGTTVEIYSFEDYVLDVYYGEYGGENVLSRFIIITTPDHTDLEQTETQ